MKLATFTTAEKGPRVGLIALDGIVDLSLHLRQPPVDMISLIANWPARKAQLEFIATNHCADVPFDAVEILAPVPKPGKILSIFPYPPGHGPVAQAGGADARIWLNPAASAAYSPFAGIPLPGEAGKVEYKGELALVIGRRCRSVTRAQAAQAIFGYCAAIGFSVPEPLPAAGVAGAPSAAATRAPLGPWIVTREELESPHALGIRCFVNGEQRQDSNTRNLPFDCFDQVRHLSRAMTLEPGDVIVTEAPDGARAGRAPRWLKSGDVVLVEIERIGAIHNTVVLEPR